jgi:hypothetical protein
VAAHDLRPRQSAQRAVISSGALGEPAGQLPHRGGELLLTRAGVSATDVTPSKANGAAGEPARLQDLVASGGSAGRAFGD